MSTEMKRAASRKTARKPIPMTKSHLEVYVLDMLYSLADMAGDAKDAELANHLRKTASEVEERANDRTKKLS